MADIKTKQNEASVAKFIQSITDDQKRKDSEQLIGIMEEISGEKAKMWGSSIIGFGSYHYKYASGREGDWMLVGFSPRKQNLTIYIMSGLEDYDKSGNNTKLLEKLGKHSTGKSCLYIKSLADIDIDVLKKLITSSVEQMRKAD